MSLGLHRNVLPQINSNFLFFQYGKTPTSITLIQEDKQAETTGKMFAKMAKLSSHFL